jgi:hypothetical protein
VISEATSEVTVFFWSAVEEAIAVVCDRSLGVLSLNEVEVRRYEVQKPAKAVLRVPFLDEKLEID